ncbi:hypothetical protein ILUMI_21437 [Ignelater luminosus]|uniref:Uncharacterized protein n=1 Tax=Ignelater luminosus TaxID=2038154 RepID=A0A8K0CGD4_IGNLU|nr:hypothetical protein ILUMI_21437 [Ignelater luminosus]
MQASRLNVSFENIILMSNVKEVGNKRKSKGAQKSQVLTSISYKYELEARASVSGQYKRCSVKRIGLTSPTPSTSGMYVEKSTKGAEIVDAVIEINTKK